MPDCPLGMREAFSSARWCSNWATLRRCRTMPVALHAMWSSRRKASSLGHTMLYTARLEAAKEAISARSRASGATRCTYNGRKDRRSSSSMRTRRRPCQRRLLRRRNRRTTSRGSKAIPPRKLNHRYTLTEVSSFVDSGAR